MTTASTENPANAPQLAAATRGRVLIVDDDPAILEAMGRMLRRAGYTIETAADGLTAADALARRDFDVVVTDITLPGMDGLQLLRATRERHLDLPVILSTGAPAVESAVEALEYGAFQYLTKPVDPERLEQVLDKAIRLHRMARMKREAMSLLGGEGYAAGDRAGLEASFDRALSTLWIAFQPIVGAHDASMFGYEALLRSREPTLPNPGAVIHAAERLGRLHELGRVIRATAAQAMSMAPDGTSLFVNLHTRDLLDEELLSETSPLARIARRVVLEITERASLDEIKDVRTRIARLREIGYRIAVDDLGAGYAGLTSFTVLEPDIVKLDMSLVRDIHKSAVKQKLVRSMASLCTEMKITVVGEGVEVVEERDLLRDLGCTLLQGYLIGRPAATFALKAAA